MRIEIVSCVLTNEFHQIYKYKFLDLNLLWNNDMYWSFKVLIMSCYYVWLMLMFKVFIVLNKINSSWGYLYMHWVHREYICFACFYTWFWCSIICLDINLWNVIIYSASKLCFVVCVVVVKKLSVHLDNIYIHMHLNVVVCDELFTRNDYIYWMV